MQNNERKVVELNINDVLPNRFQPRIKFDENSINELATSIKKYGVIQPIVVRQIGDKYEIIAGERRYKASVLAGKTTIPAIVSEMSDKDSVEIALIENVQREDLTPIEKAISYKKILDMGYISQDSLAQKIGKSQSAIANTLRLLNLSEEVQEALLEKKISERHARSLLKVKEEKDQVMLLNRIINERLTVRKTDEEIEKMYNNVDNNEVVTEQPVEIKEEVVNIPETAEPTFDFNQPIAPEFNFVNPVETPVYEQPSYEVPFAEEVSPVQMEQPMAPEFNFVNPVETPVYEQPSYEVPFAEEVSPVQMEQPVAEFNFENPVETPVYEQPSYEVPFTEEVSPVQMEQPMAPEFNFVNPVETPVYEQPSYEVPFAEEVSPVQMEQSMAPEFNFVNPVETPVYEQPSYEVPFTEEVSPVQMEQPMAPGFMNIDSIEQNAQDINPEPKEVANIDNLLAQEQNFEPTVEVKDEDILKPGKFFTFDENDNDSNGEQFSFNNYFAPTQTDEMLSVLNSNSDSSYEVPFTEEVSPVQMEQPVSEFNFENPTETPVYEQPSYEVPFTEEVSPVQMEQPVSEFNFENPTETPVYEQPSYEVPFTEEVSPVQMAQPMAEYNFENPVNIEETSVIPPVVANNTVSNMKLALDVIRECESKLQQLGYEVDFDEIDLENMYQVIINISK